MDDDATPSPSDRCVKCAFEFKKTSKGYKRRSFNSLLGGNAEDKFNGLFLCLPCAQEYLTSTRQRIGRPSQTKRKASGRAGPSKRMRTDWEQQEMGTPDVIGTAIRFLRGSYYKKAIQVLVHHSVAGRRAFLGVHGNMVKEEVRTWVMPDWYTVGTMSFSLSSLLIVAIYSCHKSTLGLNSISRIRLIIPLYWGYSIYFFFQPLILYLYEKSQKVATFVY